MRVASKALQRVMLNTLPEALIGIIEKISIISYITILNLYKEKYICACLRLHIKKKKSNTKHTCTV